MARDISLIVSSQLTKVGLLPYYTVLSLKLGSTSFHTLSTKHGHSFSVPDFKHYEN
jgi:hypothetical protein